MSKANLFLIINILIIFFSIIIIIFLGKRINGSVLEYSKTEITKISNYVINYAIDKRLVKDIASKNLIDTNSNDNSEIKYINYNVEEVNLLLEEISKDILVMFRDLENGKSEAIDLEKNLVTNTKIIGYKKGIIFEIPLGVATNNFILSNLGPSIPVKASLSGNMSSYVSTNVVEYGINNAIVTVSINVSVSMKILLPFLTDDVVISRCVPISMFLLNGKIPNYYSSGISKNSALLNTPVE